jgi:hypothetical protein
MTAHQILGLGDYRQVQFFCDSAEFDGAVDAHFMHHLAAMELCGHLAGSEFRSDLLRKQA